MYLIIRNCLSSPISTYLTQQGPPTNWQASYTLSPPSRQQLLYRCQVVMFIALIQAKHLTHDQFRCIVSFALFPHTGILCKANEGHQSTAPRPASQCLICCCHDGSLTPNTAENYRQSSLELSGRRATCCGQPAEGIGFTGTGRASRPRLPLSCTKAAAKPCQLVSPTGQR